MKTVYRLIVLLILVSACSDTPDQPPPSPPSEATGDARVSGTEAHRSAVDAAPSEDAGDMDSLDVQEAESTRELGEGGPDVVDEGPEGADDASSDVAISHPVEGSLGCGLAPNVAFGGVQITENFSDLAGGERSYFLSIPPSYDASVPQRLIIGYAGTNWTGAQIAPYLALETTAPQPGEIYVYPDLQWHDFEGWGNMGGWLLGPHAYPAHGSEDLAFTRELIASLSARFCIDPERIFATGHSWGGDMAAVVGCFLGDIVRAVAPAAANRPYWFEPSQGVLACTGSAGVWTFFGQNDPHFSWQAYPGEFGDEQVAFWRATYACGEEESVLEIGAGECVAFEGCAEDLRYCLYGPESGHQIPPYFSQAVLAWFRSY